MRARRLGLLTTFLAVAGLTLGFAPGDPTASAAASSTAGASVVPAGRAATASRPNVVLITADDMRVDDLEVMPRTKRLLAKAGVTFTDALSNYPLCCPARATLLTGQYSHNNGILGNEYPWGGHKKFYESGAELETLPVWLKRAGYSTGFVGKYLNYYGTEKPAQRSTGMRYVPPGWDEWNASVGKVFRYYCVTMNQNGLIRRHRGKYQTDLYSRIGEDFIEEYAGAGQPFFLWASHLAPHVGVTPAGDDYCSTGSGLPTPAAERHERMFAGMPLPSSPALNEADMGDKGSYMRDRRKVDLDRVAGVHQGRLQALQSLDESVARTISALAKKGVLDETLVVFASDNGWLLGEHRAEKKILPYEESLQVPLLMRGPGLPSGVRRHQPVGLVDVPPTILELAGATATKLQDGVSLTDLARDPDALARRVMPIEAGPVPHIQRQYNTVQPPWYYRGARSSRFSYIQWQMDTGTEEELYDLAEDPFQLDSRHATPSPELRAMRALSEELEGCAGAACVAELPAGTGDGSVTPRQTGDTAAPRLRDVEAPKGWILTGRPTVTYRATDPTDPARSLSHWCSHQARGCDGSATFRLDGEGEHSWTIHVTDRAGNVGSSYGTVSVDLYRPRVRTSAARFRVVDGGRTATPWRVRDSGSGIAGVDLRKRTAALGSPFSAWVRPARLQDRTRPIRRTALPAGGGTVCLEVRARDVAGRTTSWTGLLCRARALDAARLVSERDTDWRTAGRTGWFAGTATTTRVRGASLSVPSTGAVGVVRVVAATGPGAGKVRIDVGGRTIRRLDLDRARRGLQEFVLPAAGAAGAVTATVTSAGKPVSVDSVGVVRRPSR
ncbi:MAG TPA: sulfatase-like hydrolase/transferase [Nocardioidaceae bacterium]|nr:sulfatase-like hydrolase/transferase [Nocardioidaceae bacterium]